MRARYAVSIPYYEFHEVLSVRPGDAGKYRSLADLKGMKVAITGAGGSDASVLNEAMKSVGLSYNDVEKVYLGVVAGPVEGGVCAMTNLSWRIDETALSARYKIPVVRLLNDFAAVGYGIATLGEHDMLTLQRGTQVIPNPRRSHVLEAGDLGLRAPAQGPAALEQMTLDEVERVLIQKALARHGGRRVPAARELGVTRQGLAKLMARLGIEDGAL